MKNLFILPTLQPSRLWFHKLNRNLGFSDLPMEYNGSGTWVEGRNIYITNSEEIKEGDWFTDSNNLLKRSYKLSHVQFANPKKIILTTDQDLIKDGVQAIDDEFLEWFVKNPSCERVEVIYEPKNFLDTKQGWEYEIIIPKEEPKLTNVCIKCGVDLYYADNFACQEHPKSCKGIHLSEETLKERALKEEPKQENDYTALLKPVGTKQETLEEVAEKFYPGVDRQVDRMLFIKGAKWQQEQDKNMYSEDDLDMFRKFMIQEQNFSKSCLDVFIEQFKKK